MRTLTSAAAAALSGPSVALVILVEMVLSETVRLASCPQDVVYGGQTFLGAGALGSIDAIEDKTGETPSLKFNLSGVPSEMLSLALQEQIRNKPVTVWLAVLDPDTHAVLDAPVLWTGTLDQMPISAGKESSTISVTAEHRGATFARPKPVLYTEGDQQRLYPGDTSLRFIVSQANRQDIWPAAAFFRQ